MEHGNLSNKLAPIIGIRFERVIKTDDGKLNRTAKAFLEYTLQNVQANTYIVTTGDARKALAFLMKWGVPHQKVIAVDSLLEIAQVAQENQFVTYYDLDNNVLSNVSARGKEQIQTLVFDQVEVA